MNSSLRDNARFRPESFVVASFFRCGHDNFARALEKNGLLGFYALGTRRGTDGVSPAHTRLNPVFGLLNHTAEKYLPTFQAESFRFRLYPLFDRWVRSLLQPGQHLITSFAFANSSIRWAKAHGGLTFIDAQNSHPQYFWKLLTEEQRIWNSPYPPVAKHFNQRGLESIQQCDYVFACSPFVRDSFLEQGCESRRVLLYDQPVNLEWFKPAQTERPANRPLTLLNTGALCLRKGTPYLLEAFRLIRKKEPNAILRLSQLIRDDAKAILRRYENLPIDWAPPLNLRFEDQRRLYVQRFQTSDIFVFPTIEEGFAFVVKEALACGLPVVTTKNSGASDLIRPGENGELIPIRNPEAVAEAVLKWWSNIREGRRPKEVHQTRASLSPETFEKTIMNHLSGLRI